MLLPEEPEPEPEELVPELEPLLLVLPDFSAAGLDEDESDFSAAGAFSLPAFSDDFSPPEAAGLAEVSGARESLR